LQATNEFNRPNCNPGNRTSGAHGAFLDSLPRKSIWVFPSTAKPKPGRPRADNVPFFDIEFWMVFRRRAGLTDVRVHDLLHTFASHAGCAIAGGGKVVRAFQNRQDHAIRACGPTIHLDSNCQIFQCLNHALGDVEVDEGRGMIFNRRCESWPAVIHANGPSKDWLSTDGRSVGGRWRKFYGDMTSSPNPSQASSKPLETDNT
jgi:hypothetical protein